MGNSIRKLHGHAWGLAAGFVGALLVSHQAQAQVPDCTPTFSAPPPPYCAPIDEGTTSGKSFWDNLGDALAGAWQGLSCCRGGACPQHGGSPTPTPTPEPPTPEPPTPEPAASEPAASEPAASEPAAPAEKPVIQRNPVKVYLEPEVYDG